MQAISEACRKHVKFAVITSISIFNFRILFVDVLSNMQGPFHTFVFYNFSFSSKL
jgi:hypothetical protein